MEGRLPEKPGSVKREICGSLLMDQLMSYSRRNTAVKSAACCNHAYKKVEELFAATEVWHRRKAIRKMGRKCGIEKRSDSDGEAQRVSRTPESG